MRKRTQDKEHNMSKDRTDYQTSYSNAIVERTYKDRLFRLLFGSEQYKENLLELYHALNHCHYTDVNELEITTIENVIYIGMKNDASFLLHGHIRIICILVFIKYHMPM